MTMTLIAVVVVALFFDFTNGFHDTANSIATSVSTRALSPRNAVLMAAILNFVGAFISFKVAATMSGDVDVLGQVNFLDVWNHDRFLTRLQREQYTDDDARALAEFGI